MAKVVKMCDMAGDIAMRVFAMLNAGKVQLKETFGYGGKIIETDIEPRDLIYPEGWYYAKGTLRNKHKSTTGAYSEVFMVKSNGDLWRDSAKYCTLD